MNRTELEQELRTIYERLGRVLKSMEHTPSAQTREAPPEPDDGGFYPEPLATFREPPREVEYDRSRLDGPPRARQPEGEAPRCNCGLPAEFKKSAPQSPKQWAAYFCARPPRDPKNCGFKQWVD